MATTPARRSGSSCGVALIRGTSGALPGFRTTGLLSGA